MSTNVMVLDSGARGHAILWHLDQCRRQGDERIGQLFAYPGNAGMANLAQVITRPAYLHNELMHLHWLAKQEHDIGLTIVGSENMLAEGIVNMFRGGDLNIFGPMEKAAEIESSKAYAKELMEQAGIPTAASRVFTDEFEAKNYVRGKTPIVVKADGLAAGKGVYVCHTDEQADDAVHELMHEGRHDCAGAKIVIEEYLEGYEISLHAICHNGQWRLLPAVQDHKYLRDGDEGPMTGGMGAVAPLPWLRKKQLQELEQLVVAPLLGVLRAQGRPFNGLLFPGIMMTKKGPRVLEYNARWGDPETICLMRLLKTSLLDIIEASLSGRLAEQPIEWRRGFAASVVLTSDGYPGKYDVGHRIYGLRKARQVPGVVVFHAGTRREGNFYLTAGGRVLNVSAVGETLDEAIARAYQAAECINFQGMYCRRDIGLFARRHSRTIVSP